MQNRSVYTEREATAFHEAGHATIAYLKKIRIIKVTIVEDQRNGSLGYLVYSGKFEDTTLTDRVKDRIKNQIQVAMSGLTSEYIFTGKRNWQGASHDIAIIQRLVPYVVPVSSTETFINELWQKNEEEIRGAQQWRMIKHLAEHLLDVEETIDGKRAMEILRKANTSLESKNLEDIQASLRNQTT